MNARTHKKHEPRKGPPVANAADEINVARAALGNDALKALLLKILQEQYGISEDDLVVMQDEVQERKTIDVDATIPVVIFREKRLSCLEAIVKLLRENRKLSYARAATLLNRNPKSLAVTYAVARKKHPAPFPKNVDLDSERVPFSAFQAELSVLETISSFLHGTAGKSYSDIARLLNKDPRTIWTVCRRAAKKQNANAQRSVQQGGAQ